MIAFPLHTQVTRDSVLLDTTLLAEFSKTVQILQPELSMEAVENIHALMLEKIYNARSNEFLRTVSKLDCVKKKKAVDANVGLRDKLKSYAVQKQSHV